MTKQITTFVTNEAQNKLNFNGTSKMWPLKRKRKQRTLYGL